MKILVTGGAGFIGSALVRYLIQHTDHQVLNIDKLTYAANLAALESVAQHPRYQFKQMDILSDAIPSIIQDWQPDAIMHLAAESHVDKSLEGPAVFMQSNIMGTFALLEAARHYWEKLSSDKQTTFRFLHVSTDEVFGDLGLDDALFHENTAYSPSSPYSASKASADHLVRAWYRSFGLPTLITNCSNNYGPWQYPEKLIPRMIMLALSGKPLTIYGSGTQIRDWLYVDDHVRALYRILTEAKPGSTYNIGGHQEKQNIEIVHTICDLLEKLAPNKPKGVHRYTDLIEHVSDRAGHDHRYAIDASKIQKDLGWVPEESFEMALQKTIAWYLSRQAIGEVA